MTISATRGGLMMGLVTPLHPCAPLYTFFAVCLATGSAIQGAEFALAFAIGTVPLLWASQLGMQRLQLKLGPKWIKGIQRSLAIIAALFIAKRLLFDPTPNLHPETNAQIKQTTEQQESSEKPTKPG